MINPKNNERRDWTLLIFIIPIGIILIILVGQLAVQLIPFWSLNTDMNSHLQPDASSARPFALLEPILPQILTPMAWAQTYLTPGAEISFPPFLTFEPTATPSPTAAAPTETETAPTPTATTPSPAPTGTAATPTPPTGGGDGGGGGGSPTAPTTCTDPAATNNGGPLPCTYPPTTCTDPAADNFGGPLPCDYTSTTTCIDPAANNNGGPLPCDYGVVSTIDPTVYGTPVTPIPPEIGSTPGPPDNPYGNTSGLGNIDEGTYIVINFSIVVENTPDANYDLVLYEFNNGGVVYLDSMIIGISQVSDGSTYYEVFNWGDGVADNNTNVGDVAGSETEEQLIPLNEFYDPDDPDGTSDNQTGILVDVDTAASDPPSGVYDYIVVIAPIGGGSMEVDSIDVTEVPIPTP